MSLDFHQHSIYPDQPFISNDPVHSHPHPFDAAPNNNHSNHNNTDNNAMDYRSNDYHSSFSDNHHYMSSDYNQQPFASDIQDRRLPNAYHSDYQDDYTIPFAQNQVHHFQDRLPRFPSQDRYQNNPMNNGHDMLRSVPPAHSFRDNNISPYDDVHYMSNPHTPMHAVDETLSRMKLQGHPMMGPAGDLQTFIRLVLFFFFFLTNLSYLLCSPFLDQYVRTPNRLAFGERSVIVMSSRVAQKSYGTEKRYFSLFF